MVLFCYYEESSSFLTNGRVHEIVISLAVENRLNMDISNPLFCSEMNETSADIDLPVGETRSDSVSNRNMLRFTRDVLQTQRNCR